MNNKNSNSDLEALRRAGFKPAQIKALEDWFQWVLVWPYTEWLQRVEQRIANLEEARVDETEAWKRSLLRPTVYVSADDIEDQAIPLCTDRNGVWLYKGDHVWSLAGSQVRILCDYTGGNYVITSRPDAPGCTVNLQRNQVILYKRARHE